jgi:hypothetical protein
MKRLVVAAMAVTLAAGCTDKATEQFRDAPRATSDNSPADIITFPDGFSNLAAKCDGTTRIYVAFKGDANRAAIAVSANHPACTDGTSR